MQALPLVWLLGKVQSGKSSIVRTLTQRSTVEVGQGFKPCTRASFVFEFPEREPIIRFMDTRGIGESAYDATDDVALAAAASHLVIVAVRVMDLQQTAIVEILTSLRHQYPKWPVLIALTNLHEGYTVGAKHFLPYPYLQERLPDAVPSDLQRCIDQHKSTFASLPGKGPLAFVPIDFTMPDDGYEPFDYGVDAMIESILQLAPAALAAAVAALPTSPLAHGTRSNALILQHAAFAAAADVVPLAGLVAVPAVQARMLQQLALLQRVTWDKRVAAEFAAALGSTIATRTLLASGARQLSRLVPVYGQTVAVAASSASSFAVTYALGTAAQRFLLQRRRGSTSVDSISDSYRHALRDAFYLSRRSKIDATDPRQASSQ